MKCCVRFLPFTDRRSIQFGLPGTSRAGGEVAATAVAVLPFQTRGEQLGVYGEGMVDLLTINLEGLEGIRTINSGTVIARWRSDVGSDFTAELERLRALRAQRRLESSDLVLYDALSKRSRGETSTRLDELKRLQAGGGEVVHGVRRGRAQPPVWLMCRKISGCSARSKSWPSGLIAMLSTVSRM